MKIKNGILKPLIFILAIAAVIMLATLNSSTLAYADFSVVAPFSANITVANGNFTKTYDGNTSYLIATYNRMLEEDESVSYRWYSVTDDGDELIPQADAANFPITNVAESGTYKVKIKISNPEYEYESETERTFTVNPRPAVVTWDKTTQLIYNGYPQVPTAQARGTGTTYLTLNLFGHAIDAGSGYLASVTCDDENYILTSELSYSFSILPKEVTADWSMSPSRYLYNGEVQVPMVVVRDIFGSILPSTVLGGATDANEGGYPATVTIDDPNYRLERSSATTRFYIDALPVDVIWESLEILYTGSPISPTATATGINGFDIPLTYTGSGVESSNIAYTVQASTLNPNYLLQDALQDFWIRPRPVEVEWLLPSAGFTYNTRDQSVNVRAQYTRPDETFAPLNIRIEGNVAFRNAGTYNVVAVMPADINNFVLEDDGENTVELTINKAKPNILVGNRRPVFTYSGENFAIVTDINADVEPIFTMGESTVSNAFREAGVYTVQIATRETDNYIAAAPVTVILTINDIYFQTSESTPYTASIVYQRGNNPNAVLKVRQISPYDIPRYDNQWGRSVKTAFEVTFDIDGESTSLKGRSELTFKLPEKYAKEETIKIISYSNGAYREQEVENKNGYVTIKLAQDGVYAIVETNDNYIFIWWTAIAVIFFAIIIGTVIHFSQKNKIIG